MSATLSMATLPAAAATVSTVGTSGRKKTKVTYIGGLGGFDGLKRHNKVTALGVPVCADQQFAKMVSSLRSSRTGKGGAFSSTCNAAEEIFKIAAIMNGLVLVGVAVGFVLLRIEASVEEAE